MGRHRGDSDSGGAAGRDVGVRATKISRSRALVWHAALRRSREWLEPAGRQYPLPAATAFVGSFRISAVASLTSQAELRDDWLPPAFISGDLADGPCRQAVGSMTAKGRFMPIGRNMKE